MQRMKIEVIEKKREESRETPFVVGGVYKQTLTGGTVVYYVLTGRKHDEYAWMTLSNGSSDTITSSRKNIESTISDCNMTYVPNARLVIDENEGEAN